MKGKATITLCDAASGRVVKQIEEHNMVTNALSSIFQPPKLAMLGGLDFSRALKGFLPMSSSLIGGLVLLRDSVKEDAENFMFRPENPITGHAGGAYSGTEATRGTLNENESYATENGYHFTWDFPTDKANGTISCCCLTNKLFGNIGTSIENTDGTILVNPGDPNNKNVGMPTPLTSQTGHLTGMFEPGILTFFYGTSGFVNRKKVKLIDPDSILINDATGGVVIEDGHVSIPFVPDNVQSYFVDNLWRVYFFSAEIQADTYSTKVAYFYIDILTGAASERFEILLNKMVSTQGAALFENRFYQFANNELNVFDLDGLNLESYTFKGEKFFVSNGVLCAVGSTSSVRYVICFTKDGPVFMRNNGYIPLESGFIPLPYTLHTQGSPTTNSAHILMFTNYLATINNLSEPIEKTSAQTLKVSYDITNT